MIDVVQWCFFSLKEKIDRIITASATKAADGDMKWDEYDDVAVWLKRVSHIARHLHDHLRRRNRQ